MITPIFRLLNALRFFVFQSLSFSYNKFLKIVRILVLENEIIKFNFFIIYVYVKGILRKEKLIIY